jgi:hypothetical protein
MNIKSFEIEYILDKWVRIEYIARIIWLLLARLIN